MSIVTKKGDRGMTFLFGKEKVYKNHERIEACGALDELCSFLGLSKSLVKNAKIKNLIETIQRDLFIIGSEIVVPLHHGCPLKKKIGLDRIKFLEDKIKKIESKPPVKKNCFYIPGASLIGSTLDVARAVARRFERRITALKIKKMLENQNIIVYVNRLSDLLYLLARAHEKNPRTLK